MSTAGSAPNSVERPAGAPLTPHADGSADGTLPPLAPARRTRGVIRWRGVVPLILVLCALVVLWHTIGEALLRNTVEEAAGEFLGTQVDVGSLEVRIGDATLEFRGVSVADPFDPMRNLIEAQRVRFELERRPLLERKIVVRSLTLAGLRTATARRTRARPAPANGFAASTLRSLDTWASRLRKPVASFTPIDTIRSIVLNPAELGTVQAALALAARTDSTRDALTTGYRGLALQPVLDSARAVGGRLAEANPRTLGIDGTRKAVADVRRTIAEVDAAKRRVETLARDTRAGVTLLGAGVQSLDSARRSDYAFARSLLKLPSISGPDLGGALFGDVSIDRFQKMMYWAEMAQRYVPPGLLPRERPGPKRLRLAGSSVAFPKAREYPDFLLKRGDVDVDVAGRSPASGAYVMTVTNLTTMPALVREPTRFTLARRVSGRTGVGTVARIDARGTIDHVGGRIRDSIGVDASGVGLPSFPLPGLPLRAELGHGTSRIDFLRVGDSVAARWILRTDELTWTRDSAAARPNAVANTIESLAIRTITGVRELEVVADLTGDVRQPTLEVRSNLDRELAERLRAVAGEELARAETKVRAQVDRIVEERTAPVRAKVDSLRAVGERQVAEARTRLDEEKARLEARLKALLPGRGLLGLP